MYLSKVHVYPVLVSSCGTSFWPKTLDAYRPAIGFIAADQIFGANALRSVYLDAHLSVCLSVSPCTVTVP